MRRTIFFLAILAVANLIPLSACTVKIIQLPPGYSPALNVAKNLESLDERTLPFAQELQTLVNQAATGAVIKTAQLSGQDTLNVAYTDGYLRIWNLQAANLIAEFNMGFILREGTSFNSDGTLLTTALNHTTPNETNVSVTTLGGINLWETQSGKKVNCYGLHCSQIGEQYHSSLRGAILHPNGNWLISFAGSVFDITRINGPSVNIIFNLDNPDDNESSNMSLLAFDAQGDYLAVAYEEGFVELYEFNDLIDSGNWMRTLTLGQPQSKRSIVDALNIDPTRRWLSFLTNDEIKVWDLKTGSKEPYFSITLSGANTLAFNGSGSVLLVGTETGLVGIDMNTGAQIAKFEAGRVTTLLITTDNRLLIWGDKAGTVHLWGVGAP